MMDQIIKRLFESKQLINPSFFTAEDHSTEAYDLMDFLEAKIVDARNKLFDDVDIDDTSLESKGSIDGNRTIIYTAVVATFNPKTHTYKPLKSKAWKELKSELSKTIVLSAEDDKYDYSVDFKYEEITLKIILRREEKF